MANKAYIRRVYPGGNTYKGFYSFYDYILGQREAKRIVILKGGPGVGKSSFMKKLGQSMYERGYDVEYHHCSSDNNSVDGVVFPKIGVAFIDGTAPHVVDPKNPGAVDEIIHLGNYWDEQKMVANRSQILNDNAEVGRYFKRAYGYLAAAKGVYDNLKTNINESIDNVKVNKIIEQLVTEIFGGITFGDKMGRERHLFGSAITPDGVRDYLETIIEPNKDIFVLEGVYNSAQSNILKKISEVAINKGYDVEIFHNHFVPQQIDHLVIKDRSVALTASPKFNSIENTVICIDCCLNKALLEKRGKEINIDKAKYDELINLAVSNISLAKEVHDRMEEYYIPNMDFKAVDKLITDTLNRILDLDKE